jgi:hypothetical protein
MNISSTAAEDKDSEEEIYVGSCSKWTKIHLGLTGLMRPIKILSLWARAFTWG